MIDGTHDIQTCVEVQEKVLTTVYKKIQENGVFLEGSLLKPAMVVPGVDCENKSDPTEIAEMTVRTLERSSRRVSRLGRVTPRMSRPRRSSSSHGPRPTARLPRASTCRARSRPTRSRSS